eukprot:1639793-Rhodomonas_salina.1
MQGSGTPGSGARTGMPGSGNAGVWQWNGGAGVPGGVCLSAGGASARGCCRGRPSISNKPFNSIISPE